MKQIFLVGPMGSGKSTVGKQLAQKLKSNFIDTDVLIEAKEGLSVPTIFAEKGEKYFRQLEHQVIACIGEGVVATGGGLPVFNNNMEVLKKLGKVFYLEVNAKTAMARMSNDNNRPLLHNSTNTRQATWEQLLKDREEVYLQAHHTVNGNKPVSEIIIEIQKLL